MAFILAADGRDDDPNDAFRRYSEYLKSSKESFPPGAYALAASDWYHNFNDHRSPHDAWLESCEISEWSLGDRSERRGLELKVRLLGAYQDGHIELTYPNVVAYAFNVEGGGKEHQDWRYDELRLSDDGRLIHRIE